MLCHTSTLAGFDSTAKSDHRLLQQAMHVRLKSFKLEAECLRRSFASQGRVVQKIVQSVKTLGCVLQMDDPSCIFRKAEAGLKAHKSNSSILLACHCQQACHEAV